MRRATAQSDETQIDVTISIHALHEESDAVMRLEPLIAQDFNPRSP